MDNNACEHGSTFLDVGTRAGMLRVLRIFKFPNCQFFKFSIFKLSIFKLSNFRFGNFSICKMSISKLHMFEFPSFRISNIQISKKSTFWNFKPRKSKSELHIPSEILRLPDSQIWIIIFVKGVPVLFFIFWNICVINAGSEGPYSVTLLVVPKMFQNRLQSIRNH